MKVYLSHGSTGISEGTSWQEGVGVEVFLHEADRNYSWLRMKPDNYFSENIEKEEYTVMHTPGHSPGSVCLLHYESKTLFSGDTLGGHNGQYRESTGNDDQQQTLKSIEKISKLDFENVLPFHYEMILGNAADKLREAGL